MLPHHRPNRLQSLPVVVSGVWMLFLSMSKVFQMCNQDMRGGNAATAHYEQVSTGDTGHAESVRIRFNPKQITYQQLLQVFFNAAHDPTELNRQGPDDGNQYRSVIFYTTIEQQKIAQSYIKALTASHKFSSPIVTQIVPLQQFYPAEKYHQNYCAIHPDNPYIIINDMPKLKRLCNQFPALYQ